MQRVNDIVLRCTAGQIQYPEKAQLAVWLVVAKRPAGPSSGEHHALAVMIRNVPGVPG